MFQQNLQPILAGQSVSYQRIVPIRKTGAEFNVVDSQGATEALLWTGQTHKRRSVLKMGMPVTIALIARALLDKTRHSLDKMMNPGFFGKGPVHVNVSLETLADRHFADRLAYLLNKWPVEPTDLALEVLEQDARHPKVEEMAPMACDNVKLLWEELGIPGVIDDIKSFGGNDTHSLGHHVLAALIKTNAVKTVKVDGGLANAQRLEVLSSLSQQFGDAGQNTRDVKVVLEHLSPKDASALLWEEPDLVHNAWGGVYLQSYEVGRPVQANSL
jgi:hypothetical protein